VRASTASIIGFLIAFALLGLGAAVGVLFSRRGARLVAVAATAVGSASLAHAALLAADDLPRMRRVVELAEHLRPVVTAGTRLYCVNDYVQPLPFYLQRPCTLVGYRGELDFGLQQEPARWIADLPSFAAEWRRPADAVAILRPQDYPELQALGAPMSVIYTDKSFVVVARQ
jgi:hypothetical protein